MSLFSELVTPSLSPQPVALKPKVREEELIDYSDYPRFRKAMYDRVASSVQKTFPVSSGDFTLKVEDVRYEDRERPTVSEVKEARLNGKSLTRKLYGRYVLTDKDGNEVSRSNRKTLLNVPMMDDRGTFVRNGSGYIALKQLRLVPNAYTRQADDGTYTTQMNVAPGTGTQYKVNMDPANSEYHIRFGGRKVNLYPILRAMGVQDEALKSTWGREIFKKNAGKAVPPHTVKWIKDAVAKGKEYLSRNQAYAAQFGEGYTEDQIALRYFFDRMKLDPEVTVDTLGAPYSSAGPDAMVAATRRILKVARQEEEADSRDSMRYQKIYDMSDFMSERIRKDKNRLLANHMWKLVGKGGDLSKLPSGLLDGHVDQLFNDSGMMQIIEEINPMDPYNQNLRVVRLGEGAIPSLDSAPKEARNVQPSYLGFVDPVRSPESLKVGLDLFLARNSRKGPDNQLYSKFFNPRTGETEWVDSRTVGKSIVAFPDAMDTDDRFVPAISKGNREVFIDRAKVDYILPAGDDMFSYGANSVPLTSGVKGMRLLMGSKFLSHALPLEEGEAPLVQGTAPGGTPIFEHLGKYAGASRAKGAGVVRSIKKGVMKVDYADGTSDQVEMYDHFPLARKTMMHSRALVKPGDVIKKGQILAASNFTDDKGSLNIGKNLTVGYMGYKGYNFEDAVVISEEAAKKLASTFMYKSKLDLDEGVHVNKSRFKNLFPGKFSKDQLSTLDDSGAVKKGTVLNYGDPMILAVKDQIPFGGSGRRVTTQESQVWLHHAPGRVTDVVQGKDGVAVYAKSTTPMKTGDKLALPWGSKGVSSIIVPTDQMPRGEDGKPLDLLLSPLGIISRTNPAQVASAVLAKVARKTGKGYAIDGFSKENMVDFAIREMQKHNVKDQETVFDPATGKQIPKVFVGVTYAYRQQHTAEGKGKSRSTAGYTMDGTPSKGGPDGAKHTGPMEMQALLSHNVPAVIRDMKLIKGQENSDFWRKVKLGQNPTMPKTPQVYDKFRAMIRAAGVNLKETEDGDSIFAMTDSQVKSLTGNRRIDKADTFTVDFKPIRGGLFDPDATGRDAGDRFSYIELPEPVLNPIMEGPVKAILGLTGKQFDAIVSGEAPVNGKRGGEAMKELLSKINVNRMAEATLEQIKTGPKSKKDAAIKRYGYLKALEKQNLHPADFLLSRVPVLPPKFRPIVRQGELTMVADPNKMYQSMFHAIEDYRDSIGKGEDLEQEARTGLYKSFSGVVGTDKPYDEVLRSKGTGGILQQMFGKGSPKTSFVQRKVIGTNMDLSGLGVIIPDPSLKLNEAGIPREKAWELYEAFVIRDLVQKGMPAATAAKSVEERTKAAHASLEEVVKKRPVLLNRAPTLHKYGMMAFWPKLMDGDAIHIPPQIVAPYGADFDGDLQINSLIVNLLDKDLKDYYSGHVNYNSKYWKDRRMAARFNLNLPYVKGGNYYLVHMEDFPYRKDRLLGTKDHIEFYEAEKFLKVPAYDETTGSIILADVHGWSVHKDREIWTVDLHNKRQIISDDDERAVYGILPGTLEFARRRPEEAKDMLVPMARTSENLAEEYDASISEISGGGSLKESIPLDKGFGHLVGFIIGDGWNTYHKDRLKGQLCFSSTYESVVEQIRAELGYLRKDNELPHLGRKKTKNAYGESYTHVISHSDTACLFAEFLPRGAQNKALPPFWFGSPRDFKLGLLSGLLDSDGSISVSNGKSKPQLMASFTSTSLRLVQEVQHLCWSLGISGRVSFSKTTAVGNDSWILTLSAADLSGLKDELNLANESKKEKLYSVSPDKNSPAYLRGDIVPVSREIAAALQQAEYERCPEYTEAGKYGRKASALYSAFAKGKQGYLTRDAALKGIHLMGEDNLPQEWVRIVANTDVTWARVTEVENTGKTETGYDLTVPGYETFMSVDGVILSNTMSYTVPVTREAVQEAIDKMLPEKNLLSTRDGSPNYVPGQEYLQGLYFSTKAPRQGKVTTFKTKADMKKALNMGLIQWDSPVKVLEK